MMEFNTFSQARTFYQQVKKQQENERFYKSLEVTATFILISFFMFFAIRPTIMVITSLVAEIKTKEELVGQMRTKINNIIIAQDNFAQVQEKYGLIEAALPSRPQFYHSANQINGASIKSSTSLRGLSYNLTDLYSKKKNGISQYEMVFNIRSYFNQAMEMVDKMAFNRRPLDFTVLRISSNKDNQNNPQAATDPNLVDFNFYTNLYYLNNNEEK